jgi:hypothetical protein
MQFSLELKFMPEYEKNLGYRKANTDIALLNQVIDTKIVCNEVALRFGKTLEQATLCWFQILLDRLNVQSKQGNYFDRQLSILMEKDVIAPQVTYGTYESECFVRENQSTNPNEEPFDEFIDLHNDLYQAGRRGVSTLPMLIFKHPYVIEKDTGHKLRISKQNIVALGWSITKKTGFGILGCNNFHLLHQTKD